MKIAIEKIKMFCLCLLGILMLGVMTPNLALATDTPEKTSDFGERFEMKDGKLVDKEENKNDTDNSFQLIFERYRAIIAGISGVVAISMLLFFILQAFRLGSSAHNASERQKAIQGLIWLGIGTAISGSVSLFAGLFYGMLA